MHKFIRIIPAPAPLQAKSLVYDLKARLDWGEPALTIIDARDREQFHSSRITGAISIPANELSVGGSPSLWHRTLTHLELTRDIYIYGETDEETAEAAAKLRSIGYQNVSELRGGLAAWKAVGFPIESIQCIKN